MSDNQGTSGDLPSCASHRMSQQYDASTPPLPPPKPNSAEESRTGTPITGGQPPLPPPPPPETPGAYTQASRMPEQTAIPDPGAQWLPRILEDKSKQDLTEILSNPSLLSALTHAKSTAHPSTPSTQTTLLTALQENISLAQHLLEVESRLQHLRASVQTQLLNTHALERQWKSKQSEMDRALAPFSPSSLYQRLGQGVNEQAQICEALEESFLDGDGNGGVAGEREVLDWVRRYRDARKVYYARREKKERFDEGRVGGWR